MNHSSEISSIRNPGAHSWAEVSTIRVEAKSLDSLGKAIADAPAPLVWLLDAGASPMDDALTSLLQHAPGPAASLPIDSRNQPVEALMGSISELGSAEMLEAIAQHRLPLERIPITSLLVERDLTVDLAPPDTSRFGVYAGAEWTARLFTRQRGMLVPASRVHVPPVTAPSPIHLLRAARSEGWSNGETIRKLVGSVRARIHS